VRKKYIVLIISVIIVVSGCLALRHWWTGPATSTISSSGKSSETDVLGSQSVLEPFETAYFTTRKPSTLTLRESSDNSKGAIQGRFLLKSKDARFSDQAGITIGNLDGALNELSAVKLRLSQPENYQPTSITSAPLGAIIFSSTREYETAVFWQKDGRYAAVAISGAPQREDELNNTLSIILSNWQWR
jgi:hypothetical protein